MELPTNACRATDGVDALVMSAAWRPAGLDLLRGARAGWTTADLARWLLGPYAEATSRMAPDARDAGTPPAARGRRVDAHKIAEILQSTCDQVVVALEGARADGGPDFVREAIRDGSVVPTMDGLWIPLDRARMLLKDRVLSLFAADYLLRPQDYVGDLVVCSKCRTVVFDPAARPTGYCGAHRISGFVELLRRPSAPPLRQSA